MLSLLLWNCNYLCISMWRRIRYCDHHGLLLIIALNGYEYLCCTELTTNDSPRLQMAPQIHMHSIWSKCNYKQNEWNTCTVNPFTGNPGQPVDVHSVLPQLRVYPRLTVGCQIPPWVNPQLPVKGLIKPVFYLFHKISQKCIDGCRPNLVGMGKGRPSRSSYILMLIQFWVCIQNHFSTLFNNITIYGILRYFLASVIHNDWCIFHGCRAQVCPPVSHSLVLNEVFLIYTGVGNSRALDTSSTHVRTSTAAASMVVIHVDPSTSELLLLLLSSRKVKALKCWLVLRNTNNNVNQIWNLYLSIPDVKIVVCLWAHQFLNSSL